MVVSEHCMRALGRDALAESRHKTRRVDFNEVPLRAICGCIPPAQFASLERQHAEDENHGSPSVPSQRTRADFRMTLGPIAEERRVGRAHILSIFPVLGIHIEDC